MQNTPYTHICSQVAEFNYLFGVIDYNYPNTDDIEFDRFNSFTEKFNLTQMKLRFSLIAEEIKELEQAIKDKNAIEIIDALCDILYVVAGAKVYFNLPIDKFEETEMKSIRKMPHQNPNIEKYNLDYIIKMLDDELVLKFINKIKTYNNILGDLTELFINEKKISYHPHFLNHLIKLYHESLNKIVKNILRLEDSFMIDLLFQFDIVHKSNMTKVCILEEDAKETIEWYKINETRYKQPSFKKINFNQKDYYVIYDAETKKILKSIKYVPAKFI
jgi:hypothetical protein